MTDALSTALGQIDPGQLKAQLVQFIPASAQKAVARSGVRDEHVFPVPILLEKAPTLVGYYRLLLGVPQKTFYGKGSGMAPFKSMETDGTLNDRQRSLLPEFCRAMCAALADLVRQLSPTVTTRDVQELQLLTLGSFFQGQRNNDIGNLAIKEVFLSIKEIVQSHLRDHEARRMAIKNSAGRAIILSLASDPDIRIEEEFPGELRKKVAIEVKGGTDQSNVHNRVGEAEKSHQKAKKSGFLHCWTLIAKRGIDVDKLRAESPTTTSWFDVAQILGRQGEDWTEFCSRLADVVGIPLQRRRRRG